MDKQMRVAPDRLLDFATAVYARAGMPRSRRAARRRHAGAGRLWGHQSHGVLRLSWYVARLQAGVMKPVAKPELVVDAGAIAVIDGHDGDGPGAHRPRHGGSDPPRQGARHRRGRAAQLEPFRHRACTTR